MKITLDEDKCCGSGQCVLTAPELFDQRDSDGIGFPLRPFADPRQQAAAREAAMVCPGRAISLDEAPQ